MFVHMYCIFTGPFWWLTTYSCWGKIHHRCLQDRTFPKFGNSVARRTL